MRLQLEAVGEERPHHEWHLRPRGSMRGVRQDVESLALRSHPVRSTHDLVGWEPPGAPHDGEQIVVDDNKLEPFVAQVRTRVLPGFVSFDRDGIEVRLQLGVLRGNCYPQEKARRSGQQLHGHFSEGGSMWSMTSTFM